jgi:parallel beta-helix repeat protein
MLRTLSVPALLASFILAVSAHAETITLTPGPDVQMEAQEALILAEPGSVIQFEEGTFDFTMQLSLDVEGVTIRGRGMDKTILSFKNQDAGSEGLYVTSDNVVLEDFAIEDAKGNCFKSNGTENLVIRNVRTEWTGGPKETNGAYGLYPVSSKNVLIEGCVAIGASDAGIYVGQTENVVVRDSRAEYNVAGIEIENCHHAEVYNCVATNNTGGILVFDLPGLPMQKGRDVRIFDNKVYNNDTPNFAPAGNIVAGVCQGTGVMVMSNSNVEVFNNEIKDHRTYNVLICSYISSGKKITDPNYYPYPEAIHIHSNTFGKSGWAPTGQGTMLVKAVLGGTFPDIVWDGVVNAESLVDGRLKPEKAIVVRDNEKVDGGEVTFANLDSQSTYGDPDKLEVDRDLANYGGSLPPVKPVQMAGK